MNSNSSNSSANPRHALQPEGEGVPQRHGAGPARGGVQLQCSMYSIIYIYIDIH